LNGWGVLKQGSCFTCNGDYCNNPVNHNKTPRSTEYHYFSSLNQVITTTAVPSTSASTEEQPSSTVTSVHHGTTPRVNGATGHQFSGWMVIGGAILAALLLKWGALY
jgi:hypothetical protein